MLVFGILAFIVVLVIGIWLSSYTAEVSGILGSLGLSTAVILGVWLGIVVAVLGVILVVVAFICWAIGISE